MKKGAMSILIISILLFSIISASLVNASLFGDVLNKITGKTSDEELPQECIDAGITEITDCIHPECIEVGITDLIECSRYIYEVIGGGSIPEGEELMEACREIGIMTQEDCDKFMAGEILMPECVEAGATTAEECSRYLYDKMRAMVPSPPELEGCIDSDGGLDYYLGGESCIDGECVLESCNSDETLTEFYCEGGDIKTERYECLYGCRYRACIREEELEPIPPLPEPEPETCADKIVITSDKEFYYIGDYMYLTQVILDSEGNPIPNYRFYIMYYDFLNDKWEGGGSTSVGSDGYTRPKFKLNGDDPSVGFGKFKAKVYTKQIGSCDSVETIFEREVRKREPVPCGIGNCVPEEEKEPEEIPDEKVFYICNGCELEDKCYPVGYREAKQYCDIDSNGFIEQSKAGTCDNNFECESNVCVSGECISKGLMKEIINWFKKLFGAEPKPPELEQCSKLLIEKDIGDYEYFISEYGKREEHQMGLFSDDGEQIGIVKCCVAGYKNPDGTEGKAGIVCPFDNEKDVENSISGLLNNGDLVLGEYKGQKIYRRFDKPEEVPEVIVWTNNEYLIASGAGPGEGQLSEEVADAYLRKYPNDLVL